MSGGGDSGVWGGTRGARGTQGARWGDTQGGPRHPRRDPGIWGGPGGGQEGPRGLGWGTPMRPGGTQAWRTAAAPGRPPAEPPGERSRRLGRSSSRLAASSGCRNTSGAGPGGGGRMVRWGGMGMGTPQETWGHPRAARSPSPVPFKGSQCHTGIPELLPVPQQCLKSAPSPKLVPFKASQAHSGAL